MAAAEQYLLSSSHPRVLGVSPGAQFVQTVGREKTTLPIQAHFWVTSEPVPVNAVVMACL